MKLFSFYGIDLIKKFFKFFFILVYKNKPGSLFEYNADPFDEKSLIELNNVPI